MPEAALAYRTRTALGALRHIQLSKPVLLVVELEGVTPFHQRKSKRSTGGRTSTPGRSIEQSPASVCLLHPFIRLQDVGTMYGTFRLVDMSHIP